MRPVPEKSATTLGTDRGAALLTVVAVPFMQPFLLGGDYTPIAIALVGGAVALSAANDRGRPGMSASARSLGLLFCAFWLWEFVLAIIHPATDIGDLTRSTVSFFIMTLGLLVVLRDPGRRQLVVRWLIGLVIAVSTLYAVTLALWLAIGPAATVLPFEVPLEGYGGVQAYFPFSLAGHGNEFGGVTLPRWQGLGREPGVQAALSAWSIFTAPGSGYPAGGWWCCGSG